MEQRDHECPMVFRAQTMGTAAGLVLSLRTGFRLTKRLIDAQVGSFEAMLGAMSNPCPGRETLEQARDRAVAQAEQFESWAADADALCTQVVVRDSPVRFRDWLKQALVEPTDDDDLCLSVVLGKAGAGLNVAELIEALTTVEKIDAGDWEPADGGDRTDVLDDGEVPGEYVM